MADTGRTPAHDPFRLAESDLRAIAIALDELESYVNAVGAEDEAHMRQQWAIRKLRDLLDRYAKYESLVAAANRHGGVVEVPAVRFTYRPTPPSGPTP